MYKYNRLEGVGRKAGAFCNFVIPQLMFYLKIPMKSLFENIVCRFR